MRETGGTGLPAGAWICVLALAWLPGQFESQATRFWVACGVLPFFVGPGEVRRLRRQALLLLPTAVVAASSLLSAAWLRDPGSGLRSFLVQASWTFALAVGLGLRAEGFGSLALLPWVAVAGAVAALPPFWMEGGTFGNASLAAGFLACTAVFTLTATWQRHSTPNPTRSANPPARSAQNSGVRGTRLPAGFGAAPQETSPPPEASNAPPTAPTALNSPPTAPTAPNSRARRTLRNLPEALGAAITTPWGLGVLAGLQLLGLLRCGSLGAWLAVALGVGAWACVRWLGAWPRWKMGLAVLTGLMALAALGFGTPIRLPEHLAGRLHLDRTAWAVAKSAWPQGVGAGQFHSAFLEAQVQVLDQRPEDRSFWSNAYHAHNEPLHALAEQGIAALLLLLPWLLGLFRPRADAAWAVVVAMVPLCLVSFPWYEPASWVLAWMTLGLTLGREPSNGGPETLPTSAGSSCSRPPESGSFRTPTQGLGWLLRCLALGCGLLASAQLIGDRLLARGGRTDSEALLARAAQLVLRPAAALQYRADLLRLSDPAASEKLALQALALDPSPRGWLLAGMAAMHREAPRQAIPAFQEAIRLNPRLFAGHFNLARAYEEAGDRFSARRHADRARSLRPGDPRLRWLPQ